MQSVDLATAIAASEYHESSRQAEDNAGDEGEDTPRQRAAIAADEELARALEFSKHAAIQEDEDSKRKREQQQQQDTEASELAVALDVSKEEAEASLASVALESSALRVKRARTQ